jgi:hypothetical protein
VVDCLLRAVQVQLVPKTPGLELVYWGPDSDRAQDEYSYSSKFSLGGKVTAGYDDKEPKAGVELSGGAEFTLQMPYPVQRGSMESKQYASFRLPAAQRERLQGIDLAVSLGLEESSSMLQNWTAKFCNVFNCNCTPESWVKKYHQLEGKVISFPLAAHPK